MTPQWKKHRKRSARTAVTGMTFLDELKELDNLIETANRKDDDMESETRAIEIGDVVLCYCEPKTPELFCAAMVVDVHSPSYVSVTSFTRDGRFSFYSAVPLVSADEDSPSGMVWCETKASSKESQEPAQDVAPMPPEMPVDGIQSKQ